VASQKAPEPRVAEPVPWVAGKLSCGVMFVGCPGYRFDEGAAWTFPLLGCVTGLPECGLGWGCILVRGSDFGVLEVDFFCTLFLKIAVFWPDLQSLWWGTHRSRGWYFPDVLRDRQVELAYLGIVLPFGDRKPRSGGISII